MVNRLPLCLAASELEKDLRQSISSIRQMPPISLRA
jgi:hypothetical protein